ncbi:MAG: UDP-N-acetylglucosamine 2-epimerase [Crocinitomix sp. MedPE-SWsnd]|jgi:UDP-GlcNAc3NAcA epimerase|nr:MAG: UDP-N-acetylglucosamine 2-epimerase [Crocinitomix sp. MedPE-SWsnd]
MKIITIIGARPQIIKAAAISRAIRNNHADKIQEVIVHTGQHYDENMSKVFFEELQIPRPDYNLAVGSGSHGKQTAKMLDGIEEIIMKEKPQALLVYGDTNSTVAGGLAASKLHIPLVHIEAGLRSYNKAMPEEINRITCDHMSTLLFSPTSQGSENLAKEGFDLNNSAPYSIDNPKVYHCGDIMFDNSKHFSEISDVQSTLIKDLGLGNFILSTIHRNNNTDDPVRLNSIFKALLDIAQQNQQTIVLPLHPRTKKMMEVNLEKDLMEKVENSNLIKVIPPVSFLDVIALEKNASMVVTDSGGVQKEAFFFEKPCLILRSETEWVEIVENGNAIVVDADYDKIMSGHKELLSRSDLSYPPLYGDGKAAEFICNEILNHI